MKGRKRARREDGGRVEDDTVDGDIVDHDDDDDDDVDDELLRKNGKGRSKAAGASPKDEKKKMVKTKKKKTTTTTTTTTTKKKMDDAKKAKKNKATAAAGPDANWRALLEKGGAGDGAKKRRQQKRERPGSSSNGVSEDDVKIDWTRRMAKSKETRMVALDCEMVGVGSKDESRLARVCVINERGEVLLDRYSKPMEAVTNYRTQWSGIRPSDLEGAPSFWNVQVEVADLVRGKMLVGHQLQSDLDVLMLKHPRSLLRDTARYAPMRRVNPLTGRRYAAKLRDLCLEELGKVIQDGEHDPYVDARAALEIYKKHSATWERHVLEMRAARREIRDKRRSRAPAENHGMPDVLDMTARRSEDPPPPAAAPAADVFSRPRARKHKR